MNVKVVAGGIVIVLILAGLVGLVANKDSDNDSGDDYALHETWNLLYVERASFVDENHNPVTDVNDCSIGSRYIDPRNEAMKIQFTDIGKHIFRGKIADTEVSGRYGEGMIWFSATSSVDKKHVFYNNGMYNKDRLALSTFVLNNDGQLCYAMYSFFVNDSSKPVSPMMDRVNYDLDYELVSTKYHTELDFAPGGNPAGRDASSYHEYVKSHSMISLFTVNGVHNGTAHTIGIQAIVSLGTDTLMNSAYASVGTSVNVNDKSFTLLGDLYMSDGKMEIFENLAVPSETFFFIESEYNVPFHHGPSIPFSTLADKYTGTVTTHYKDGTHHTREIQKNVTQVNKTVYITEEIGGSEYIWFGALKGGTCLEVSVRGTDRDGKLLDGVLRCSILPNGDIESVGTLYDRESNSEVVVIYKLTPVRK